MQQQVDFKQLSGRELADYIPPAAPDCPHPVDGMVQFQLVTLEQKGMILRTGAFICELCGNLVIVSDKKNDWERA